MVTSRQRGGKGCNEGDIKDPKHADVLSTTPMNQQQIDLRKHTFSNNTIYVEMFFAVAHIISSA